MAALSRKGAAHVGERRRRASRARLLALLGCMAVLVTAFALMAPAISITQDNIKEEDGFYGQVNVLEEAEAEDAAASDEGDEAEDDSELESFSDYQESGAGDGDDDDSWSEVGDDGESWDEGDGDADEPAGSDGDGRDGAGANSNGAGDRGVAEVLAPDRVFHGELLDDDGAVTFSVDVEAPEGAFPEGTTMQIESVNPAEVEEAVDEAVARKTDGKISGMQAVDIVFFDAEGDEVQPQDKIAVKFSSPRIAAAAKAAKQAAHPESAQTLVVHVDDDGEASVVDQPTKRELAARDQKLAKDEVLVDTDAFSVYVVVYTVDFHWEVDGKTYEFSIPGGGFVSFTDLVEVLGLANQDMPSERDPEPAGENAQDYMLDVEASEATREFVADVTSMEFSNPELVDVSRVDEDTTVGQIKESRGLEVQFSAELTKDQIAEIDAQAVEAGDWALISLKPFITEEMLTITMGNGDQYVIRVTDASYSTTKVTDLAGKTVALVNLRNNNALESTTHRGTGHLNAVDIEYDANENTVTTTDPYVVLTKWTFEPVPGYTDRYYISSSNGYLRIDYGRLSVSTNRQALQVQQKPDGTIRIKHPDNNYAVNNDNNSTANGYAAWSSMDTDNRGEWFTAFEIGAGAGMIALNPMNENGVLGNWNHTSTSYKNMKIDGVTVDNQHLQNSRMFIPVSYNNFGEATITLPSHGQLGSFSVSSAEPGVTHSIEQATDKYQWVLKGWVNIATGQYYDTSSGPATATVKQDDLNVFYADWWAADYDRSLDNPIDTADTSSFATIKMWDYNELFNLSDPDGSKAWSVDHDNNQFIPRTTLESEEWYITQVNGHQGDYFQFVDNTDSLNCWQYGTLGNQQGRNGGNQWSNYDGTGSLGILGRQGEVPSTGVLESLFPDTITPGSGVNYLGQGNYLFSYDPGTKIYSYDSASNGAVYNKGDGRFYVSSSPREHIAGGGVAGSISGFLPLNDPDPSRPLAYNNGTINYWFGMSIDVDFWLPDAPGSSNNANLVTNANTGEKQHMRFDFNGDDDVWVLIDGKLALDIGGIHEAVGGYIDFTTGEIRNAKGNTYNLRNMDIGSGAHTLSFYYLERGGNASNCKITFNISPRWVDEPVQRGVASVTKTWSDDTPEEMKQALSFHLETDGAPVPGSTVGYADGTVADGVWSYVWSGLDPNTDYVVVEGEDPLFIQTATHEDLVIQEVWAAASYDKEHAFGSQTIILGNGLKENQGGKLLYNDGRSLTANIDNEFVQSTVSDNAKWTVDGYDSVDQHFYLKNPSGQYLSIKNGSIALVNGSSNASLFYMSPSGDLNDALSDYRLMVNGGGSIGVGAIVNSADETDTNSSDRIHVYTYHNVYAKTTSYNVLNTYGKVDLDIVKVDATNMTTPLEKAQFKLKKLDPEGRGSYLSGADAVEITSDETDRTGKTSFNGITAGYYEISEVKLPAGYVQVEDVKFYVWVHSGMVSHIVVTENDPDTEIDESLVKNWAVVEDNDDGTLRFSSAQAAVENDPDTPEIDESQAATNATFTVGNTPGAALPNAGGPGTTLVYLLGIALASIAGVGLVARRRRKSAA